jgi:hypothetical protein
MKSSLDIAKSTDRQTIRPARRVIRFTYTKPIFPPWVKEAIAACPSVGGGLNEHMLRVAGSMGRAAELYKITYEVAFQSIVDMAVKAGRPLRKAESEARRALDRVDGFGGKGVPTGSNIPKAAADLDFISSIVIEGNSDGSALDRLIQSSPIRMQPESATRQTNKILRTLFPNNPWLCFGVAEKTHDCMKLDDWISLEYPSRWEYIVPSPQLDRTGLTDDGRPSTHAKANCGTRRFLVVEFDFEPERWQAQGIKVRDAQATLILYLAKVRKPVMVVSSGGKSLHTWFLVEGMTEPDLEPTFRDLQIIGADPRTFLISQFVRMPDGTRTNNGARQSILYLDKHAIWK